MWIYTSVGQLSRNEFDSERLFKSLRFWSSKFLSRRFSNWRASKSRSEGQLSLSSCVTAGSRWRWWWWWYSTAVQATSATSSTVLATCTALCGRMILKLGLMNWMIGLWNRFVGGNVSSSFPCCRRKILQVIYHFCFFFVFFGIWISSFIYFKEQKKIDEIYFKEMINNDWTVVIDSTQ